MVPYKEKLEAIAVAPVDQRVPKVLSRHLVLPSSLDIRIPNDMASAPNSLYCEFEATCPTLLDIFQECRDEDIIASISTIKSPLLTVSSDLESMTNWRGAVVRLFDHAAKYWKLGLPPPMAKLDVVVLPVSEILSPHASLYTKVILIPCPNQFASHYCNLASLSSISMHHDPYVLIGESLPSLVAPLLITFQIIICKHIVGIHGRH